LIGETLFVTGVCQFISAPITGRLMTRVDPRLLIFFGFIGFGICTLMSADITADWSFQELLIPQIFRGVSLMMCMVPINNLSLGTMPPDKIKNASGLFNLMRNLGGAFGLALINTMLDKRMDLHLQRLRESIVWGREVAESTIHQLTLGFAARGSDAGLAAVKQVSLMVRRQSMVLALSDVFWGLTAISFAAAFLAMLMSRPPVTGGGGGGGGH